MLFTCTPPGARIPGRFPGPAHARGKWFTLDIHCHVRSDKAAALVEGHEEVSRWFLETQPARRARRSTAPMACAPGRRATRPSSASPTWI